VSKIIFTVTYTEDYELVSQYAYENRSDADKKEAELSKKLFNDSFKEYREDFDDDATYMDYQLSASWWDADCRSMVHLVETVVEESYVKGI